MLMLLILSGGMRPSIRPASTVGSGVSSLTRPARCSTSVLDQDATPRWFSAQGYDVIAVEPSSGMRSEGQRLHPDPRIRWINDQLPDLERPWSDGDQLRCRDADRCLATRPAISARPAFRKVAALVRSGGLLAITLRSGPSPPGSEMYPVSLDEIERLARNHGFAVEKVQQTADQQGRDDISWTSVALRLPDDGTGALPLLRHVILNDQKSATYKLGLLRALCRAADGSAGMVQDTGDEFVRVPLGLVALNWLRLYFPLIRESLPQTPANIGAQGLGFAKEGFQNSPFRDFGERFAGRRAVHS